ncbi:hypothetical protein ACFS07_27265 [Undibacterium arcticum]
MTVNKSLIAVLLMTAGLGACGGGGSVSFNTSPPPAGPSEGLWQGSTSSARTITTFVLDNGVFWILYSGSGPNPGTGIAGLIQGSGTSINGSFFRPRTRRMSIWKDKASAPRRSRPAMSPKRASTAPSFIRI